jgi:xanthine dehydrogenase large subunit
VSAHETKTLTAARTAEALASTPHVGRSVTHEAAELHVTGAALYTDDLAVRDRGALAGWPVCAPHASAWLDHLDVSPALAVPGVVRVLTAASTSRSSRAPRPPRVPTRDRRSSFTRCRSRG